MQLHLRSVGFTGVWGEWNYALKGIELHCIAFKGIELRAVNLGTMDRGEGGGRDPARLDDHQGPQDCCILSPHSHQVVLGILRWKMQWSFPFFSCSDLRGRWVLVTIITVTSSPHGRCMCMMHNFAVHQFVTSRAALTSYLHHFILPGWHRCISSLTSIRQRLRLGNLSLVIYILDRWWQKSKSFKSPYLVFLTTTYPPSGQCAAFFAHNGCLKSQTRHYWLRFQQTGHSRLEV